MWRHTDDLVSQLQENEALALMQLLSDRVPQDASHAAEGTTYTGCLRNTADGACCNLATCACLPPPPSAGGLLRGTDGDGDLAQVGLVADERRAEHRLGNARSVPQAQRGADGAPARPRGGAQPTRTAHSRCPPLEDAAWDEGADGDRGLPSATHLRNTFSGMPSEETPPDGADAARVCLPGQQVDANEGAQRAEGSGADGGVAASKKLGVMANPSARFGPARGPAVSAAPGGMPHAPAAGEHGSAEGQRLRGQVPPHPLLAQNSSSASALGSFQPPDGTAGRPPAAPAAALPAAARFQSSARGGQDCPRGADTLNARASQCKHPRGPLQWVAAATTKSGGAAAAAYGPASTAAPGLSAAAAPNGGR